MKKAGFLIVVILCALSFSTNIFLLSILYEISKISAYCLDKTAIPTDMFSCMSHPLLAFASMIPIIVLVLYSFTFFIGSKKGR